MARLKIGKQKELLKENELLEEEAISDIECGTEEIETENLNSSIVIEGQIDLLDEDELVEGNMQQNSIGQNLVELMKPYYGSKLFLAVTHDRSKVLLTSPDIRELYLTAQKQGLDDYVILKAPKGPYKGHIY